MQLPSFAQNQFIFVSEFGDAYILPLVIAFSLGIYLVLHRYRNQAILMLFTLFSFVYATFLKLIFRLPRPSTYVSKHYIIGDIYGFPSSHVTFYTAFWGFIIYLAFTLKNINRVLRLLMVAVSSYYLVLIGGSRIALGAHSVTDVIGGYFFGSLYLAALIFIDKNYRLKSWYKNKPKDNKGNNSSN